MRGEDSHITRGVAAKKRHSRNPRPSAEEEDGWKSLWCLVRRYLTMSVMGCVWQGQGQRYILADLVPLRGPQMEEFKSLAPHPGICSLCDGYSALQPAELVHKNELCEMKME